MILPTASRGPFFPEKEFGWKEPQEAIGELAESLFPLAGATGGLFKTCFRSAEGPKGAGEILIISDMARGTGTI